MSTWLPASPLRHGRLPPPPRFGLAPSAHPHPPAPSSYPRCGGTSFNKRLTMLTPDGAPPCRCKTPPADTATTFHNGHALVVPKSCNCPRRYRYANHTSGARRRTPPAWAPINQRIPGAKKDWAFLQHQWLMSPDTTGWLGGVHSPVPRRAPSHRHRHYHHHYHHRRRRRSTPPRTVSHRPPRCRRLMRRCASCSSI